MTRIDNINAKARELAEAMYPVHPDPMNLPTLTCYQHGSEFEREVILRRWRQENRENQDLIDNGYRSWRATWPDSHEEFLVQIGLRERNRPRARFFTITSDDRYVEPRGFHDRTDSWSATTGGPTGTMGTEEWGR